MHESLAALRRDNERLRAANSGLDAEVMRYRTRIMEVELQLAHLRASIRSEQTTNAAIPRCRACGSRWGTNLDCETCTVGWG